MDRKSGKVSWIVFLTLVFSPLILLAQGENIPRMNLNTSISLSYNDNVGLAEENTEKGWNYKLKVGGSGVIPFGGRHELTLTGDIQGDVWDKWNEINAISGGLGVDVDYDFDFWKLNLHTRYTRSVDPTAEEIGFVTDVREFRRYYTTTGFKVSRLFGGMGLEVGADYTVYHPEQQEFEDLKRDTISSYLEIDKELINELTLYLRYTHATVEARTDFYNDSKSDKGEVGIKGWLTPRLGTNISVGYQTLLFDESGEIEDTSDYKGVVYKLSLTHRLSPLTRQSLSFSYNPEQGYATGNYYRQYNTSYTIAHKVTPRLLFNGSYSYIHTDESGDDHDESADRSRISLGLGYSLTENTNLGITYTYLDRESDLHGKDYTQNLTTISLSYSF